MVSRLSPYISFRTEAREAMEFYQRVFGGTLVVSTFGEFGMPDPEFADKVMHSMLQTDRGFTLMGSDTPPGMDYTGGSRVTVTLSGDVGDHELREYWAALTEGGTTLVPLEKQMWGDEFGTCEDRYGVRWMVNIAARA
ncbi:VOC family protein [Actinosynnema pretiosum]|uniref:PhnB-like domain-containing protein n=1 Tax=Actinosynnema pretiosum TaxID=42197 RepID=A0A290Z7V9_9PSEU|nr:VOC family protein [Actinosynnema pretiosum]ATE55098.1 hypothetical protein CNX65_18895 [Actinosynnema pretiosum]